VTNLSEEQARYEERALYVTVQQCHRLMALASHCARARARGDPASRLYTHISEALEQALAAALLIQDSLDYAGRDQSPRALLED
jgi:hypothetical protein